ncbi:unnamed protein product, partial [Pylaiella littoralis]
TRPSTRRPRRQLLLYLLYALRSVRVRLCARAEFCFFTAVGEENQAADEEEEEEEEDSDDAENQRKKQ